MGEELSGEMCIIQKSTCRSDVSSLTVWVLEIELRSSGLGGGKHFYLLSHLTSLQLPFLNGETEAQRSVRSLPVALWKSSMQAFKPVCPFGMTQVLVKGL